MLRDEIYFAALVYHNHLVKHCDSKWATRPFIIQYLVPPTNQNYCLSFDACLMNAVLATWPHAPCLKTLFQTQWQININQWFFDSILFALNLRPTTAESMHIVSLTIIQNIYAMRHHTLSKSIPEPYFKNNNKNAPTVEQSLSHWSPGYRNIKPPLR